jgi:hypothetical protein
VTTPASPQPPPQGQQPPPPQQGDGLDDTALAVAIAAFLAGLTVTASYAASIAVLLAALKVRFKLSGAVRRALGSVLAMVTTHPHPVTGVIGPASEQVSRMNAARRAQYVLAAARRVKTAENEARAKGESVEAARQMQLERERKFYEQHQAAMWNRARAAGQVDMEAAVHGRLISWNTVLDARTSAECRAADRKNFYADRMPDIGWPGGVHPFAGAFPGRPGPVHRCCLVAAA